ncbi:hypothetical protein D6B98_09715 [Bradyrhizobium sp. LVM 105]|nr:hypothetical protein D6B98_09715 [Bradyrhizobium sp. LVM 105]
MVVGRSKSRHCEEPLRRSNPESLRGKILDCFAALAMTWRWMCVTLSPSCPGLIQGMEGAGPYCRNVMRRGELTHVAPVEFPAHIMPVTAALLAAASISVGPYARRLAPIHRRHCRPP